MRAFLFDSVNEGPDLLTPIAPNNDVDQDPYLEEWFITRLRSGTWCTPLEPWMFDFYPKNVTMDSKRFQLTAWVIYAAHWGVNEEVKGIIERLEPGKHQFIPVTLKYGAKDCFESHTYYTLQINNMRNEIDTQKSDVSWRKTHRGTPYWVKKSHVPLVLPAESIRGLHLWRNEKARVWMMSGELHDVIQHRKLASGLKVQEQFVV